MCRFQELKWDETKQMRNSSLKTSLKRLHVTTYHYVAFYTRILCEGLPHMHHLLASMLVKFACCEKATTSTEPLHPPNQEIYNNNIQVYILTSWDATSNILYWKNSALYISYVTGNGEKKKKKITQLCCFKQMIKMNYDNVNCSYCVKLLPRYSLAAL